MNPSAIVVTGAGGVGKTTVAAALGIGLSGKGKPTLVLTVDPARRLADALGIEQFGADPHPVPGADTLWQAGRKTLTPETPVTLTWDNGKGLKFYRTYAIDENYMFTVTQKVKNHGRAAVTLTENPVSAWHSAYP